MNVFSHQGTKFPRYVSAGVDSYFWPEPSEETIQEACWADGKVGVLWSLSGQAVSGQSGYHGPAGRY